MERISPKPYIAALLAALLALSNLSLQAAGEERGKPLVISDVRIFDGEKIITSGTVVIDQGVIQEVGRDIPSPAGAEIIEGKGQTLLPGLIDSHVHILYAQALEQSLAFGVTTVLDMFMDPELMATIKSRQAAGENQNAASLFSAGVLITAPGGHGSEYGIEIPTIAGPEQAREFVDARLAEGSDYIKIVYDDGRAYSRIFPTQSLGYVPSIQTFSTDHTWKKIRFPFEQFGTDGRDLTGVFLGAGPEPGTFSLQIDNVRFD